MSVFAINPQQQDSVLDNVANIDTGSSNSQLFKFSPFVVTTTQIRDKSYLFVGSDDSLDSYSIADNGTLTLINRIEVANERLLMANVREIIATTINGKTYLFVTGSNEENGVSILEVDANGNLIPFDNNSLSDAITGTRVRGLAAITLGQTPYLLAASALGKGLVLFEVQVDSQEKLKEVASFLPLINDGRNNLATITLDGITYVYMTRYEKNNSISVFRINDRG